MIDLLRRLHIWVGLFNLTILVVFGLAGIAETLPHTGASPPIVETVPYSPGPDMTDQQVADDIWKKLELPLAERISGFALRRNGDNQLQFTFYDPNGTHAVTVLESEKVLRIEHQNASAREFILSVHETTRFRAADLRVRLWAWYVLLSIASLIFMAVTGVCLWWTSRPRLWWARASFAVGSGVLVLLWFALR